MLWLGGSRNVDFESIIMKGRVEGASRALAIGRKLSLKYARNVHDAILFPSHIISHLSPGRS